MHPLIKKASFHRQKYDSFFRVTFTDGISEHWGLKSAGAPEPDASRWYYFAIPAGATLFTGDVPIYREFEANPLDPSFDFLQQFFIVQYKDFAKAGFCNQRILVHQLVDRLVKEGWMELKTPATVLKRELGLLREEDLGPYMKHNKFDVYPRVGGGPAKGTRIIRHFVSCGDMRHKNRPTLRASWNHVALCQVVNRCFDIKEDATRSSIVRLLTIHPSSRIASGPKLPPINIWRAVFDKVKPKSIFDVDSHLGEKAIAAKVSGIGYSTEYPLIEVNNLIQWLENKTEAPDTTIITNMEPIDDALLMNRILKATTPKIIAVVSKAQATRFKPIQQWFIKTDPKVLSMPENVLVVLQKYN